jgi:hypothetical protein
MLNSPKNNARRTLTVATSIIPVILSLYGCASDTTADNVSTNAASVTSGDLTGLALANVGGTACGRNSLGGNSFFSSCTGNDGEPEYWCADFVKWVWSNRGVNVAGLTAAAGSFYVYGQNHGTLSNTPHEGDAVVFDYGGNGYADHVAIVTKVYSDGRIETVSGDWNGQDGSEADFSRTSHVILNQPAFPGRVGTEPGPIGMTISGFISPAGGVTGGPPGQASPVSCAGLDDGAYCGGHDIAGDSNTLYTCSNGAVSNTTVCAGGCTRNPGSIDDACAAGGAAAGGAGAAECPGSPGATVGAIHDKYVSLGECNSFLGGPTTSEMGAPDNVGRYNVFQSGSIYWTPSTGAFEVHGAIRDQWKALNWEAGILGYPTTDETQTPDGVGRYNVFQNGSIYWSPNTGAHEVYGKIRDKWKELGWESGALGYPTSGEYAVAGGRQNDFEHGSIRFDAATGQATATMK